MEEFWKKIKVNWIIYLRTRGMRKELVRVGFNPFNTDHVRVYYAYIKLGFSDDEIIKSMRLFLKAYESCYEE